MSSQPDPLPPRAAPDLDAIERAARALTEIDARYAAYIEASPNKHVPLRFLTPEERAPGEALGREYECKRFEFTESVRDPATVLALVRSARDADRLRAIVASLADSEVETWNAGCDAALRGEPRPDSEHGEMGWLWAMDTSGPRGLPEALAALRARAETAERERDELAEHMADADLILGEGWLASVETVHGERRFNAHAHLAKLAGDVLELAARAETAEAALARHEGAPEPARDPGARD